MTFGRQVTHSLGSIDKRKSAVVYQVRFIAVRKNAAPAPGRESILWVDTPQARVTAALRSR